MHAMRTLIHRSSPCVVPDTVSVDMDIVDTVNGCGKKQK